jgi:hypothetical protein
MKKKIELNHIKKNTKMPQCTKFSWSPFYLIISWFLFLFLLSRKWTSPSRGGGPSAFLSVRSTWEATTTRNPERFFLECSSSEQTAQGGPAAQHTAGTLCDDVQRFYCFSLLQFSWVFSSSSDIPTVSHLKIIFWRTRITRVPECGTTEMWTHNPSAVAMSFSSYKGRADIIQSCVLDFWGQVGRGVFIQLPR